MTSKPTIVTADVPDEVPPNNTFQVSVTVEQGGPDPWASNQSCVSKNLDVLAWNTPIRLLVDGKEVDTEELCLASGNTRETKLRASLSGEGNHQIKVEVFSVDGNAFDFKNNNGKVNDDVTYQVQVQKDASDPSKPGPLDSLKRILGSVADELGATTTTLGAGMALMVLLLVVV